MLSVGNATPFETAVIPFTDKRGLDWATVVIKGTFSIAVGRTVAELAEKQVPIVWADEFYAEPGTSSIRYESDTAFIKPGTDIALVGNAYPRQRDARSCDVVLQLDSLRKVVRVFGDRYWRRSALGWKPTAPECFESMPLVYDRAFGGADISHPNERKHQWERRNPVGTGFVSSGRRERLKDLPLPNLEDPDDLISSWKSHPKPAGFGFIGRDWSPRVDYAGTYDDAWTRDRCPLLPLDFDDRYFQAGHPDLISPQHLIGGEAVRLSGACAEGELAFELPRHELVVTGWIRGEPVRPTSRLDTVLIEPDDSRLVVTWRAQIPCARKLLYLDYIFVRDALADAATPREERAA